MPQDYEESLPLEETPVAYLAPSGSREEETRARTFLGSIRFAQEEMFHPIRDLSGGQKAKLLLTKFMLDKTDVLILDEPTRNFHLFPVHRCAVYSAASLELSSVYLMTENICQRCVTSYIP